MRYKMREKWGLGNFLFSDILIFGGFSMFFIHFWLETQYTRKRTDLKPSSVTYYFVSLTNDLTLLCLMHSSFIDIVTGPLSNSSFYLWELFHCLNLGIGQFVLQKLKNNDTCFVFVWVLPSNLHWHLVIFRTQFSSLLHLLLINSFSD